MSDALALDLFALESVLPAAEAVGSRSVTVETAVLRRLFDAASQLAEVTAERDRYDDLAKDETERAEALRGTLVKAARRYHKAGHSDTRPFEQCALPACVEVQVALAVIDSARDFDTEAKARIRGELP